jgi:minichromosome maintenance protein 10
MDDYDEEEDEETLQLQLQEIQARLKLKKLQKKNKQSSDTENELARAGARISKSNSVAASRSQSRIAGIRDERLERSKSQTEVVVPVSPVRRAQPPPVQRSPGRVLLGIDKGLKGSDISLKRAPSLRRRDEEGSQERRVGPFLQMTASRSGNGSQTFRAATSPQISSSEDRPKTFSERMAAIRSQEVEHQERESRIRKNRSTAFDIGQDQLQSFKENAVVMPGAPRTAPEFSRDEILSSLGKPSSDLPRNKASNLQPAMRNASNTTEASTDRSDSRSSSSLNTPERRRATKPNVRPGEVSETEATQFEPFSSTHLSKRIIPHKVLTRTLSGKKPFLIPDLLRIVKAPDFSAPDIEEDLVVFGVIASKSDPRAHQPNTKTQKKGKFMIMTLTDLKWELDLFLFDSAFDKFWKLTPGTIIAILNPIFMPPPRGKEATGKFSLTLNSDKDTVLEIGSSRDLGFCKSIKKDGKPCTSWVDTRHTEFCEYHVSEQLKKTHALRMEVNTMTFGKKGGGYGGRKHSSQDVTARLEYLTKKEDEKKTRYDRESHSQIFIGKRSTANMLDDVDFDPDAFHRGSTKEERINRRLLAQEKERNLEKKLATMGTGAGASYARVRRQDSSSQPQPSPGISDNSMSSAPLDASALGLLGGKAADIALSPVKRKRANTVSSSAAVGWGSNLSKELGRMKNGENMSLNSQAPVKKKTRFVTEKGIREAGRKSFGGEVMGTNSTAAFVDDDDDDDDLDIIGRH